MKKFIATLTLLIGFSANAGLISANLSNTSVAVGETTELSILGSGFEDFDTFYFELEFDTSLFSVDLSSLVSDLQDASDFDFAFTQESFGLALSFTNLSLFEVADFNAATVTLTALAEGVTSFNLVNILVDDFFGAGPITADVDPQSPSTVEVAAAAVPTPATLSLFAIAIFGLVGLRRKA